MAHTHLSNYSKHSDQFQHLPLSVVLSHPDMSCIHVDEIYHIKAEQILQILIWSGRWGGRGDRG